jgi:hypothetical protein
MLAEVRAAIDAYLDGCERAAHKAEGINPRGTRWQPEHVEWFVDYQVNGRSVNAIATAQGKPRKTGADGVRTAARLLGMPRRPRSRGGRPKGARDTGIRRVVRR